MNLDKKINDILKDVKFDYEIKDDIISIKYNNLKSDLDIPEGYAVKGGAARSVLNEILNKNPTNVRDYDLVRTTKNEPFEGADEHYAQLYMPEDYKHGPVDDDGKSLIIDIMEDDYFGTRDFTLNEVLATKNEVKLTKECLLDTYNNIICPSYFENKNHYTYINHKILLKGLRLAAKIEKEQGYYEIDQSIIDEVNDQLEPFWISLNLDRAAEEGIDKKYVELLRTYEVIPHDLVETGRVADYLSEMMDWPFDFKYAKPINHFIDNEGDLCSYQLTDLEEDYYYQIQEELSK